MFVLTQLLYSFFLVSIWNFLFSEGGGVICLLHFGKRELPALENAMFVPAV